jgi:hypothetical protein
MAGRGISRVAARDFAGLDELAERHRDMSGIVEARRAIQAALQAVRSLRDACNRAIAGLEERPIEARPRYSFAMRDAGSRSEVQREIPNPEGGPPRHGQAHYLPHVEDGVVRGFYVLVSDVSERKAMEDALRVAHNSAQAALAELKGLLPICAWCHRIRDESGHWETLEKYLSEHANLTITHGMCEACAASNFP